VEPPRPPFPKTPTLAEIALKESLPVLVSSSQKLKEADQ